MRFKRTHSTALEAVAYHPGTQALYVFFQRGSAYRYDGVPQSVYEGLVAAHSVGQLYQAQVRKCFPYERLSPAEAERVKALMAIPGGEGRAWVKQFLEDAAAASGARDVFL